MRLGICACMVRPRQDPVGIEAVEKMAGMGYDYVELSLRDLMEMDAGAFSALARRLENSGLRAEACNNFFPSERRITGPDYDLPGLKAYTRAALARARSLGAEVVVFGSSGARNIPAGFPRDRAWEQIVEASRMIAQEALRAELTVAVEYHNRKEANVLTSMPEAEELRRQVDSPGLKLLFDYYHFAVEEESLDRIREAGPHLVHGHFADPRGRVFPTRARKELADFFAVLREIRYPGRLSVEAFTRDFGADGVKALEVLRELSAGF